MVELSKERRDAILGIGVYVLALIGAATILSGWFTKTHYELDHGGGIVLVQTSWGGLKSDYYQIRLQNHADWKHGRPYREPPGFDEYDWFMQQKNGEWTPMDFVGPITDPYP